jgi:phospholipid/cholesterol/gamma-HCH transport system permease protein
MHDALRRLGRAFFTEVRRVVSYATLTLLTLGAALRPSRDARSVVWTQASRQIVFTGIEAIPLVLFLGAVGAAVFVTTAFAYFAGADENKMVIDVLARLLVREVAPLATAVVVALRSGAAITVELGSMSARGEIEGIETAGIDPIRWLLLPRFIGMGIATVALTLVFTVSTFAGAFGAAVAAEAVPFQLSAGLSYLSAIGTFDVGASLAKAGLFGIVSASVACYHGLSVRGDVTEVPRRVARALVEILIHCSALAAVFALLAL